MPMLRQLPEGIDTPCAVIGFGAAELGYQTLDKLSEYLTKG
jgi:hypothetical protein